MTLEYSVRKATKVMMLNDVCMIGRKPPVAHPQNCRNECPYGHDRAYCFPCMKMIMEERRKARENTEEYDYEI
ncbi:MAG: hypothetical protein J6X66_06590 [Lachnospiraceae bacterium]|nr:hypothetical protein [Lachnospiraceae bacterium]